MITTTTFSQGGEGNDAKLEARPRLSDGAVFLTFFTVPVFGHIFIADPHAPAKLSSLQKSF